MTNSTDQLTDQLKEQTQQFDALEQMFSDSRESEPSLFDQNFTKVVMNSVATQASQHKVRKAASKGLSFDVLGLVLGLVCAYLLVDISAVSELFLSFIPSSIVISPFAIIAAVLATASLSIAAWWIVEEESQN